MGTSYTNFLILVELWTNGAADTNIIACNVGLADENSVDNLQSDWTDAKSYFRYLHNDLESSWYPMLKCAAIRVDGQIYVDGANRLLTWRQWFPFKFQDPNNPWFGLPVETAITLRRMLGLTTADQEDGPSENHATIMSLYPSTDPPFGRSECLLSGTLSTMVKTQDICYLNGTALNHW